MAGTLTPGTGNAFRYKGTTDGGPPTTGSFTAGDWVEDASTIWVCTTAGTPGLWSSEASIPVTSTVANDNKVHRQWQITPASRTPFVFSVWPSGPQTDTTYDHWVGFGFNAEVHTTTATGAVSTSTEPALYMGFEDGWYDSNDSTDGSEWYVASWSPAFADGTRAVQLFRPFYTRIDRGTVATTVAAGSDGVDVATFAGAGTLNIASSTGLGFADRVSVVTTGGAAVIKYTGTTATTLTGCTTVSGTGTVATGGAVSGYKHRAATYCDVGSDFTGTFNVTRGPFAPIFVLSASSATNMQMTLTSTNETALVFQGAAGANKWTFKWNEVAGFFQIINNVNNRAQVIYTAGSTSVGSTTEFGSKVIVDSSLIVGTAALVTTATDGFVYAPTCPGTPTGVPTAKTGTVPLVFDTTNRRLYVYESAAWHYFGETA